MSEVKMSEVNNVRGKIARRKNVSEEEKKKHTLL